MVIVFWLMLDANNFDPMTYYRGGKCHVSLTELLKCYKAIQLNLGGHEWK